MVLIPASMSVSPAQITEKPKDVAQPVKESSIIFCIKPDVRSEEFANEREKKTEAVPDTAKETVFVLSVSLRSIGGQGQAQQKEQ